MYVLAFWGYGAKCHQLFVFFCLNFLTRKWNHRQGPLFSQSTQHNIGKLAVFWCFFTILEVIVLYINCRSVTIVSLG